MLLIRAGGVFNNSYCYIDLFLMPRCAWLWIYQLLAQKLGKWLTGCVWLIWTLTWQHKVLWLHRNFVSCWHNWKDRPWNIFSYLFFNMSIMIRDYFAALYNGYSICYLPESDLRFMKLVLIEWIFSVFLSSVLFLFASILCLFITVFIMSCCDKLAFILFVGLWVE